MRAFAVTMPSGERYWTVIDEALEVVEDADAFLFHVRFGRDGSELTTKAHAGGIALFLRWCEQTGRSWHEGVEHLGLFVTWLRYAGPGGTDPDGAAGQVLTGPGASPVRGARRVNAVLAAVRGMAAHAVAAGRAPAHLVPLVYEVADGRDLPDEARGEEGRMFLRLRARHRLREEERPVDRATDAEIAALLGACLSARDRLIVLLMARAGLRRGEMCGLRRCDVHLMPGSRALGCEVAGAHLHVVRRANPNGAWAKSRRQRAVPLDFVVVQAFDAYESERLAVPGCGVVGFRAGQAVPRARGGPDAAGGGQRPCHGRRAAGRAGPAGHAPSAAPCLREQCRRCGRRRGRDRRADGAPLARIDEGLPAPGSGPAPGGGQAGAQPAPDRGRAVTAAAVLREARPGR